MNNKAILGALAMDLKRIALANHRGSNIMAEKFFEEAIKRKNELNSSTIKPYLVKLLSKIEKLKGEKREKAAEDALLYSTLFQNASRNS